MTIIIDSNACYEGDSDGEIGYWVEGIQEVNESTDAPNDLKPMPLPLVHSQFDIKDFSAEEGIVSQVGVMFEGRDECDAQDALLTMEETKPAYNAQTVLSVSPDLARAGEFFT